MPSSLKRGTTVARSMVVAAMILSSIRRNSVGAPVSMLVRAWTTNFPRARHLSTLNNAAKRWNDRDESSGRPPASYSLEDYEAVLAERGSMPPPILDSFSEEEGYGAYDYQPGLYELDDADLYSENTGPVLPDEMLAEPPVRDDEEVDVPVVAKKQSSEATSDTKNDPTNQQESEISTQTRILSPPTGIESVQHDFSTNEDEPPDEPKKEEKPKNAPRRESTTNKTPTTPRPSYTHATQAVMDGSMNQFLKQSAARGASAPPDSLEDLRDVQLPEIVRQIYQENNNEEFNINSPKQVAQVVFGEKSRSTNKEVLEGMAAGGNRIADLILQYRHIKAAVKRLERRAEDSRKGTLVRSVSSVARPVVNGTATTIQTDEEDYLSEDPDPLLLVDASSYIFRAYFSMPPIHRSDGMPTGAVMGFCNMLNRLVLTRLLQGEQPRMILAFDAPGPSFRKELYPEYKANRPEAPMDLIPQFALIRQASAAYGIPIVEAKYFEADDVIATLATEAHRQGLDVHILSGDKDLMQLITGPDDVPCIHMIDPMSMSRIAHAQVVEKWGVGPELLGDVLALAGDSVDNVPGVPGIGPKIASLLLEEYHDLENLLDNAANIKQKSRREKLLANADQARISRALVALEDNIPGMKENVGDLSRWRTEPLDSDRILAFYDEMQFKDVKRRFLNRLQQGAPRKRPKSNRKERVGIPHPEDFADVPF